MRIKNYQKKHLADLTTRYGLEISDFDFEDKGNQIKITSKPAGSYFSILVNNAPTGFPQYYINVFDGEINQAYVEIDWTGAAAFYVTWLADLVDRTSTKTGWEAAYGFLNIATESTQEEFTEAEKVQAKRAVREIQGSISKLELPEDQIKIIQAKLDLIYNEVASRNKFDWISFFMGTIGNIVMFLGMPKEVEGALWTYIKAAFKGLFRIGE